MPDCDFLPMKIGRVSLQNLQRHFGTGCRDCESYLDLAFDEYQAYQFARAQGKRRGSGRDLFVGRSTIRCLPPGLARKKFLESWNLVACQAEERLEYRWGRIWKMWQEPDFQETLICLFRRQTVALKRVLQDVPDEMLRANLRPLTKNYQKLAEILGTEEFEVLMGGRLEEIAAGWQRVLAGSDDDEGK